MNFIRRDTVIDNYVQDRDMDELICSSRERQKLIVSWEEYLTVTNGKVTLTYEPVNDDVYVQINDGYSKGTLIRHLVSKSLYNPVTKEITFPYGVNDGTEVNIYYQREMRARLTIIGENCTTHLVDNNENVKEDMIDDEEEFDRFIGIS